MSANSVNRQAVRDGLASVLTTALTPGTLKAVFGYPVGDAGGVAPFVVVMSEGSQRAQWTLGAQKHKNAFRLSLVTFVAAADSATGWTEQNAENQLDLIEKSIADVLADNRGKKNNPALAWDYIALEEGQFTTVRQETVGGAKYLIEMASVIAEVKDA